MARAEIVRDSEGRFYGVQVLCPACRFHNGAPIPHLVSVSNLPPGETESPNAIGRPHWTWNGSLDRPTFAPSVMRWIDRGDGTRSSVCHSFVRDGRIQFLNDCMHDLRGQTVDLPEITDG